MGRGALIAGPYEYGLYAFSPGAGSAAQRLVAGAGNQSWDYRLANGIDSCAPGRCEAALQVPACIPAPAALASSGWQVLDNPHKRLGEIRNESELGKGRGGMRSHA
jgi:autotransporter family porin